jgi:hypothetical protein
MAEVEVLLKQRHPPDLRQRAQHKYLALEGPERSLGKAYDHRMSAQVAIPL